jgi:uncharacterized protein YidB (DUF937 family)
MIYPRGKLLPVAIDHLTSGGALKPQPTLSKVPRESLNPVFS